MDDLTMGCMINMYAEFAPIKSMNEYTFPKRRANLSSGIKAIGRSVKVNGYKYLFEPHTKNRTSIASARP